MRHLNDCSAPLFFAGVLMSLLTLFVQRAPAEDDQERTWDIGGKEIRATAVSVDSDWRMVTFRRPSGSEVVVMFSELSEQNQKFMRENSGKFISSAEQSSARAEGDTFTFFGQQLTKSPEIFGIRLGDRASVYQQGRWARDYIVNIDESNSILLQKKKPGNFDSFIVLSLKGESTKRVMAITFLLTSNVDMDMVQNELDEVADRLDSEREGVVLFRTKEEPYILIKLDSTDPQQKVLYYEYTAMRQATPVKKAPKAKKSRTKTRKR